MPINGGARENWPQAGLEAMAAGVPIVTQRNWGWEEQIQHGVNGYLGSTDEELSHYAAELAYNERKRLRIVKNARRILVEKLANPRTLAAAWKKLFESLQ